VTCTAGSEKLKKKKKIISGILAGIPARIPPWTLYVTYDNY